MNDRTAVRSGGLAITNPKIMLFALLLVYILNFLDRQIVNILAEPIKGGLGLSDTQLGLLAGPAFAVFYAVLGIPIARYADNAKTNRVWLISICLAIWSAMTAICGVAQNFVQLALARIGVGVGEAGCTPAAHSLIADSVPAEKRSSAIAFFGLGIPIGGLLGLIIGGEVEHVGKDPEGVRNSAATRAFSSHGRRSRARHIPRHSFPTSGKWRRAARGQKGLLETTKMNFL